MTCHSLLELGESALTGPSKQVRTSSACAPTWRSLNTCPLALTTLEVAKVGNSKVVNVEQRDNFDSKIGTPVPQEDVGKITEKGFERREVQECCHQNLLVVTKVGLEVRNIFSKESQNFTESYGQGTNQMASRAAGTGERELSSH